MLKVLVAPSECGDQTVGICCCVRQSLSPPLLLWADVSDKVLAAQPPPHPALSGV